jgi:hypothetical protein
MLVLVHEMSRGKPRWVWVVPPLFAVWANLQPGFIAGLGIRLWGFLSATAFHARPDITEWQPIVLMTRYGLGYAAFVALALWGIIYSRGPCRRVYR